MNTSAFYANTNVLVYLQNNVDRFVVIGENYKHLQKNITLVVLGGDMNDVLQVCGSRATNCCWGKII